MEYFVYVNILVDVLGVFVLGGKLVIVQRFLVIIFFQVKMYFVVSQFLEFF